jgi:hypothetical protein
MQDYVLYQNRLDKLNGVIYLIKIGIQELVDIILV